MTRGRVGGWTRLHVKFASDNVVVVYTRREDVGRCTAAAAELISLAARGDVTGLRRWVGAAR